MTHSNNKFALALIAVIAFFSNSSNVFSQATTVVTSTTGYKVNVSLTPKNIVAPNSCQYGYNYNTVIAYSITFSGSNIPSSLYTLQTNLYCSSQANFTSLPLSGGTGTVTTHSNPWRNTSDCGNATPSALSCNAFTLIIHGPGIASQTIYMPYSAPLPVKFSSFEAKSINQVTLINWTTSAEINNNYFAIERSADGNVWNEIGTVKAGNNHSSVQSYSFTDAQPLSGTSYYRIRQVDNNGEFTFSETISSSASFTDNLKVFPNPAGTYFRIESENIDDVTISVMNAQGQTFELSSETAGNIRTFSTEGLQNGVYFINANINGQSVSKRITVLN